ncbi:putative periplasmic serine endoprotease DegP-like [uncultured delta proteobacterium]|uniref:Probable periplasmic serine endoprotease DegP-like n=1 Tax=uncultured delta proteobacterium TaxID=34034 RepID=A0A212IZP5_9DELT|nr:putative periplasmic serine endoprotease DegP-like [uncultured delta proteobacterium]
MVRKSILLSAFIVLFSVISAQAGLPDFTKLVKSAGPAVVNINTEKIVETRGRGAFPFPTPFEEFFKDMPGIPDDFFNQPQQPRQRKQKSLGSGFVISSDGYVVTNHHVVDGADSIAVSFGDAGDKEKTYKATLIGSDKLTDLAILKIDATGLPFLKFGDSDALEVGEWVMAIGNPFGLDHTVTAGIISAKGRSIRANPFDSFLQTDASINPGNSGGPLLNMEGEVVGINAAIIANGQGIGFAIPSNMAKEIIGTLRTDKKISRGWIGVTIQTLDENGAKALGLPSSKGALIGDVLAGHPAAEAGMKPGDVILSVNGETVENSSDLSRKVAAIKPGDKAKIVVWRNGAEKDLTVKIAEREAEAAKSKSGGDATENAITESLGMTVRSLSKEDAARMRLENTEGVVVTRVENGKNAAEAGIRVGDVIIAANGEPVSDVDALSKVINDQGKKRGAVMFYIIRQGQKLFKTVEIAGK